MAENSPAELGPITTAAQRLAKELDEAKQQQENAEHARKVEQVRSLTATLGPTYSQRLAALLGQDPNQPPFAGMQWFLAEDGEESISFDGNDDLLLPDYPDYLPLLVANVEGYSVGAHSYLNHDTYTFGLSCGGGNWTGISDLESFGRATLGSGHAFAWDKVKLSQFNEYR